MVRDRFVVGLRDQSLSEALQMDLKLTLASAVARARASETVRKQKNELKKQVEPAVVDALQNRRKPRRGEPISCLNYRSPDASPADNVAENSMFLPHTLPRMQLVVFCHRK